MEREDKSCGVDRAKEVSCGANGLEEGGGLKYLRRENDEFE